MRGQASGLCGSRDSTSDGSVDDVVSSHQTQASLIQARPATAETDPVFDLLKPLAEIPGEFEGSEASPELEGAVDYRYSVRNGRCIATVWDSVVHRVVFQLPDCAEKETRGRVDRLFAYYGESMRWNQVLDNDFGQAFHRVDMERYAAWSYTSHVATFGTMNFYESRNLNHANPDMPGGGPGVGDEP